MYLFDLKSPIDTFNSLLHKDIMYKYIIKTTALALTIGSLARTPGGQRCFSVGLKRNSILKIPEKVH